MNWLQYKRNRWKQWSFDKKIVALFGIFWVVTGFYLAVFHIHIFVTQGLSLFNPYPFFDALETYITNSFITR